MQSHQRLLLLLLILVLSCKKEAPVSKAAYELHILYKDTACPSYPVALNFYTDLRDMDNYYWDFGNGTFAEGPAPTAKFNESGRHLVTLRVTKGAVSKTYTQLTDVPYLSHSVAVLCVITKGQPLDTALIGSITRAMPRVQAWYQEQTGGKTFHLNHPVVDTFYSAYTDHGFSGGNEAYTDIKAEISFALRTRLNWQRHDLLVFLPGVSSHDTTGLGADQAGERFAMVFGGACREMLSINPLTLNLGTSVAAHELGHSFDLSHNNDRHALMFSPSAGPPYVHSDPLSFPDCYLLEKEKDLLRSSPFFFNQ